MLIYLIINDILLYCSYYVSEKLLKMEKHKAPATE